MHEIDWALFEFHDDRQPAENFIPKAKAESGKPESAAKETLQPSSVVPFTSLPGLEVQCMARTSGLQTGHIMPALTSVKIFGRSSASQTYQVSGSSPSSLTTPRGNTLPLGIPGDSGAWIIERMNGRVCGHVLAWSQRKQVAYICPMDVLLKDIAETLDATEVRLPGPADLGVKSEQVGPANNQDLDGEDFSDLGDTDLHNDKCRFSTVTSTEQGILPRDTPGSFEGSVSALGVEVEMMHLHSEGAR